MAAESHRTFEWGNDNNELSGGFHDNDNNNNNMNHRDCVLIAERSIDNNQKVLEAARVGPGYENQLKDLMNAEISPYLQKFDGNLKDNIYYENLFQSIADNFTAEASKLPRAPGCFPPCGFQAYGAGYNCIKCQYDTCEYPIDCPMMWKLPGNMLKSRQGRMFLTLKCLLKVKTQQVEKFKEVTVGMDRLYAIPSVHFDDQGTYQCEVFSRGNSIIRIYYYLTVTPQVVVGHAELQDIFNIALLPGGQIPPHLVAAHELTLIDVPSPALLTACLTAMLLMLFLSMGFLYWWWTQRTESSPDEYQALSRPVTRTVLLQ
ncbi:sperm acrosome membrane-associated protein 6 [Scleropages formosus]|uniref:sperm acrosome membrane-associated protein 6 n=1 Tax=Scleropages formosus TaxID=113540 RepID=UPI0010FAA122|nr:uncharacterized protein LOC114912579 [Scleropages formosus]